MLGFVVKRKIRAAEKRTGEPLDYLREMYDTAPDAFWQFAKVAKAAGYRSKLPAAPYHVARLVAVRHQDCGPCVQTVVNLAKEDGVEPAVLRAALAGKPDELPESLRDVYHFAEAVAANTGGDPPYRERLRKVFGEEAVVELALAIALCQTFPLLKRGLGHATSCSLVKVEV
jgi:alkylhydroperoxidase family enzyme